MASVDGPLWASFHTAFSMEHNSCGEQERLSAFNTFQSVQFSLFRFCSTHAIHIERKCTLFERENKQIFCERSRRWEFSRTAVSMSFFHHLLPPFMAVVQSFLPPFKGHFTFLFKAVTQCNFQSKEKQDSLTKKAFMVSSRPW